jgi:cation diffusion facilitator family transporter
MWALKWSCIILLVTAGLQLFVVVLSGSVALFADTIHNFGDAATALPLWVAFVLARRKPTERFTYGLGRVEDFAGLVIVLIMASTAMAAGYEAVARLFHPRPVAHLGIVVVASIVGCLGNEAVAILRIRVGREIGSAALVADGYHARMDGWTSLAVLASTLGVWGGYPLADPIVGLLISAAILWLVWQAGRMVVIRAVDGVDPETLTELRHGAQHVPGVQAVTEVQARWVGHRLRAELNIAVAPTLSVAEGHAIAKEVRHQLLHHVHRLGGVMVHVDPVDEAGEYYHQIQPHSHDGLPVHSHQGA